MEINKICCAENVSFLKTMEDNFIDLTVTSPPYDKLRDYNGYTFDFEGIAKELYRVTKQGGIVVWVVGDATVKGSETGSSFRQALYFKEIGFNLHDTMIYYRTSLFPEKNRYWQSFEYMFVFSKGCPNTFNPVKVNKTKYNNTKSFRKKDGTIEKASEKALERLSLASSGELKDAENIWYIPAGYGISTADKIAFKHPAIFPEKLAENHILSWSNEGDLVLDPFAGSGTTCKMAMLNNRNYIGIEISEEYCQIAEERLSNSLKKQEESLWK